MDTGSPISTFPGPSAARYIKMFPPAPENTQWVILDIPIEALGKPRQTNADRWKQRPRVLKYRAWCDALRLLVKPRLAEYEMDKTFDVSWICVFPMPKLTKKERERRYGGRHDQKPDRDNIDKALLDCLFSNDARISDGYMAKRWVSSADEKPRIILRLIATR